MRRTPIPEVLVRVGKMFLRPAMLGWTLKAFSVTVLCLIPFAVISAYPVVGVGGRRWLIASAAGIVVICWGIYQLGKRLRKE